MILYIFENFTKEPKRKETLKRIWINPLNELWGTIEGLEKEVNFKICDMQENISILIEEEVKE